MTELRIGDALWRTVNGTFVAHYGIVVGFNFATPIILENQKGIGLRLVTYQDFANNKKVTVELRPHDRTWEYEQRIHQVLDKNSHYNLIEWNCEHLKNFIQLGESKSGQLVGVGIMAGVVLFCALAS